MDYEARYKDAQKRGDTAESRLRARKLSAENEALFQRYEGAKPLGKKEKEEKEEDGLPEWRRDLLKHRRESGFEE